jgi:hypothetical protein
MNKHIPQCKKCGTYGLRNSKYDAYYCPVCVQWIEKKCGDENCEYCKDRPDDVPLKSRSEVNLNLEG